MKRRSLLAIGAGSICFAGCLTNTDNERDDGKTQQADSGNDDYCPKQSYVILPETVPNNATVLDAEKDNLTSLESFNELMDAAMTVYESKREEEGEQWSEGRTALVEHNLDSEAESELSHVYGNYVTYSNKTYRISVDNC